MTCKLSKLDSLLQGLWGLFGVLSLSLFIFLVCLFLFIFCLLYRAKSCVIVALRSIVSVLSRVMACCWFYWLYL